MIPDRLFLVGFHGSPKLEVGVSLAERLRRPVFDTEDLVQSGARMTTQEVYKKEGESGFRQRERRALVSVATGPPAVVITGVATFIDRGNRRTMQQAGITIFLDTPLDECMDRAIDFGLLKPDEESNERFITHFTQRRAEYAKADVTVETINRDPDTVADDIIQRLEDRVWSENL